MWSRSKKRCWYVFKIDSASVLVVLDLVDSQFSVGFKDFVGFLILDETGILLDKLENLLNDFKIFFEYVIKHPLIYAPTSEEPCVFEVDEMAAGFSLGKIEDMLQVRNAQFFVEHQ